MGVVAPKIAANTKIFAKLVAVPQAPKLTAPPTTPKNVAVPERDLSLAQPMPMELRKDTRLNIATTRLGVNESDDESMFEV